MVLEVATPEEYWAIVSEHVSLAVAALAQCDADQRRRIEARAVAGVAAYAETKGVRVPGLARCTSARKPAEAGW